MDEPQPGLVAGITEKKFDQRANLARALVYGGKAARNVNASTAALPVAVLHLASATANIATAIGAGRR
jgi:hypothetical protein